MKRKFVFVVMFTLSISVAAQCQLEDWSKLIPLESNRDEVEKILGKPVKHFEESGVYRTEKGRFHIWYSRGGCHKGVEGLQWNVPARKMTNLFVYLNKALPLESYISNVKDLKREASPGGYSRYNYSSPDESIVYETIMRKDSSEFVNLITLQPGKDKQHLLCKEK